MVVSCCVIDCTSRFDKDNPRSFFRIPKKPEPRRKLWITAIKRASIVGRQQWEPTDYDRVCYRHFITGEKSNDKNNPDYIPSVNMGYKDTKPSGDLRHARHCRLEGRESEKELQPHVDIHSGCIKKIAALRIENQQLYEELGRLQTENAILKQNESRL
ncbi:THAP domain-containing protein 11-like isoform X2 [Gigantopelta aegis]|uniref:THAP domain-containing protein 11-like isoform X2 n=1 Tax=Gigantopelta aegis TaxID=1735272 RepID=UPI001B888EDB|nr:THAP domain-containing protein 11-like isoform X2 [Gigantopelta aegis]